MSAEPSPDQAVNLPMPMLPPSSQAMFMSVLQLVLAPVLVGCTINSVVPNLVGTCLYKLVCALLAAVGRRLTGSFSG